MSKITFSYSGLNTMLIIVAAIIALLSMQAFRLHMLLGSFIFFISLAFFSYKRGVQFDVPKREIRVFNELLFVKFGKWQSLDGYTDTFILTKNLVNGSSYKGALQTTNTETQYWLYISKINHRKNVFIKSYEDQRIATEDQKTLASNLNLEIVKFNPPISAKTRARRRR